MMRIIFITFLVVYATQAQVFDLEFQENGTTYKEIVTVDKQNQVLVYDVPKHGNKGAASYLKDFRFRLNVMRDSEQKICYVWKMKKDEPSTGSVLKALKKVDDKKENQQFLVKHENMLPLRKFDVSKLSSTARQFCQNNNLIEAGIYTLREMEKVARKQLLNVYRSGRIKRGLDVTTYALCNPRIFPIEVRRCYKAGCPDLIQLKCVSCD